MTDHRLLGTWLFIGGLLVMPLLSGCGNSCLDMCQQYERYLERCGYGWTTAFRDRGWRTIEDCYDDYWESGSDEYGVCELEAREYADRSCY